MKKSRLIAGIFSFCHFLVYFCLQTKMLKLLKTNFVSSSLILILSAMSLLLSAQQPMPELKSGYNDKQMQDYLLKAKKVVFDNQDSALLMLKNAKQYFSSFSAVNKAVFYNTYGLYYWFTKEYDSSILVLKNTLDIQLEDEDIEYRVEAANNIGTLYSKLIVLDSAIKYLNISLEMDVARNNEAGIAKSYYDLGSVYDRKSHYELALKYMLKSVDLHEKIKAKPRRIINNYNVLGNLYKKINDSVSAIKSFKKGLSLAEQEADSMMISMIHGNIAVVYQAYNNQTEALKHTRLSAQYMMRNQDSDEQRSAYYFNIASSFVSQSQLDSALFYIKQGLPNISKMDLKNQVDAWIVVSYYYLQNKQPDEAAIAINNALSIARSLKMPILLADALDHQAKIDSVKLDFKSAFFHFKRSRELYDSIHNKEHLQRVAELRILHDADKKEAENKFLKEQNTLKEKLITIQRHTLIVVFVLLAGLIFLLFYLQRSNKKVEHQREIILKKNIELNNLNQTKDKFISIIAHDLKSPFNSLLGLLQDMIRNFDEYDDDEKLNLLKGVNKSSFNTYNLLINLLDWTMAQRNGFQNKPERVVVKDAVEKVFQFLETRAKQKNHRLESLVGDSIVAFVDPDILSNILINLVNNAIKFTPLGGHIAVRATIEENTVSICIEDNGIGIPQDKIHKLFDLDSDFKRVGTSDELGTGLGLVMVKDFVKTSNGTISVQSNEDKGSTFCVKLPVSENT